MERYQNLNGDSGVVAFELGEGSIRVKFNSGWIYLYTNGSAGRMHINRMHQLAIDGVGLNSYISRYVKTSYQSKRF